MNQVLFYESAAGIELLNRVRQDLPLVQMRRTRMFQEVLAFSARGAGLLVVLAPELRRNVLELLRLLPERRPPVLLLTRREQDLRVLGRILVDDIAWCEEPDEVAPRLLALQRTVRLPITDPFAGWQAPDTCVITRAAVTVLSAADPPVRTAKGLARLLGVHRTTLFAALSGATGCSGADLVDAVLLFRAEAHTTAFACSPRVAADHVGTTARRLARNRSRLGAVAVRSAAILAVLGNIDRMRC